MQILILLECDYRLRFLRRMGQPDRHTGHPNDSPFITVCGSATWRAANSGLHRRSPKHFCARLNAERGRRTVGLAAASRDPRRPAPVPRRHDFIVRLKILQSLRIPAPVLHLAIGSHDAEQLRLAFLLVGSVIAMCSTRHTASVAPARCRGPGKFSSLTRRT
jgi:hypothetical protein